MLPSHPEHILTKLLSDFVKNTSGTKVKVKLNIPRAISKNYLGT